MKHKDDLGDRLKAYEAFYENHISEDKYIVLRIDGRGFSKYTKKYDKPFSQYLSDAMKAATKSLISEFGASVGYTQSDEITVVVPPKQMDNGDYAEHMFAGRTQKLVSLAAAVASVSFDRELKDKRPPMFDCRIMGVSADEAANALYWRMLDCHKNATSSAYRHLVGHRQMQGKSGVEMRHELDKIEGWKSLPNSFKYGIIVRPFGRGDFDCSFVHPKDTDHNFRLDLVNKKIGEEDDRS